MALALKNMTKLIICRFFEYFFLSLVIHWSLTKVGKFFAFADHIHIQQGLMGLLSSLKSKFRHFLVEIMVKIKTKTRSSPGIFRKKSSSPYFDVVFQFRFSETTCSYNGKWTRWMETRDRGQNLRWFERSPAGENFWLAGFGPRSVCCGPLVHNKQ